MTEIRCLCSSAVDIHVLLVEEAAVTRNHNLALELFTVPRVRRATLASGIGRRILLHFGGLRLG